MGVLLAGIDTLEVGFCVEKYRLADESWAMLESAKTQSQLHSNESLKSSIELLGCYFEVLPSGTGRHNLILRNDDLTLKVRRACSGGEPYPEIQVAFRSSFLWREGPENAFKLVRKWLEKWAVITRDMVSRADLAVDIQAPLPRLSRNYREVVTRTNHKGCYMKGDFSIGNYTIGLHESGYSFGRGGPIVCRIYDKVIEIESHSLKRWFYDLWQANGWKPGSPVIRTEFQLRRKTLRSMQCETAHDLFAQLPDLWRYLSQEWLTIRRPGNDTNRSRWSISKFWKCIQNGLSKFGKVTGIARLKQLKPRIEALERQAKGIIVSMAALAEGGMGIKRSGKTGCDFVKFKVREWLADPGLEATVSHRMAKFAAIC